MEVCASHEAMLCPHPRLKKFLPLRTILPPGALTSHERARGLDRPPASPSPERRRQHRAHATSALVQVDRLSRLGATDWERLKTELATRKVRVVSHLSLRSARSRSERRSG